MSYNTSKYDHRFLPPSVDHFRGFGPDNERRIDKFPHIFIRKFNRVRMKQVEEDIQFGYLTSDRWHSLLNLH